MGAAFEDQFVARAEFQHFNVIRIPDSCRQMRNKIIRVKSPFDFILTGTIQGVKRTAFIDVKRTNEKRFPYSSIDPHQLECLRLASFGGVAGYLIQMDWVVVFFSYEKLSKVKPRESLTTADGVLLGASGHFDVMNIFKEAI
jgi:penicillin-binding protein-related factor A (putative recombinase)